MKRKLIKQGNSTLTLSLPVEFIKEFNLKQGDEIDLQKKGNSIEISLNKQSEFNQKEINIEDVSKKITERIIAAAYRQGVDELSILINDSSIIENIQSLINNQLIGYEIISINPSKIIIKEISSANVEEFDALLRRAFLILKNIANESVNAIKNNNDIIMKSLSSSDANINKLTNLCERMLIKFGHKDKEKSPIYYHIVKEIENIGDEFKFILDYLVKEKIKLDIKTIEAIENLTIITNSYYELFYNFSLKSSEDLFNLTKNQMIKIDYKKDPEIMHHISTILRLIENTMGDFISIQI